LRAVADPLGVGHVLALGGSGEQRRRYGLVVGRPRDGGAGRGARLGVLGHVQSRLPERAPGRKVGIPAKSAGSLVIPGACGYLVPPDAFSPDIGGIGSRPRGAPGLGLRGGCPPAVRAGSPRWAVGSPP